MEIPSGLEKEKRPERGRNVRIIISFFRHAEKDENGMLTQMGFSQSIAKGRKMEDPKNRLRARSSTFERTRKTLEGILKGMEESSRVGEYKIPREEAMLELAPPDWFIPDPPEGVDLQEWSNSSEVREARELQKEFYKKCKEVEESQGEAGLLKYVLNEPSAQKDLERWTSAFAYFIDKYQKAGERLHSDSEFEIMNITHDIVMGDFLRKVVILNDHNRNRVDIKDLDALGGAINYLEGFELEIYIDENGEKHLKIIFRDKEFEADEKKISELAGKFKEKPYKGRETTENYKKE